MLAKAQELLQQYYGYPEFREGQKRIISALLEGRDTLGIMPTGGGKSICYQIPALMMEGVTLVVSPLISLMKDQVDALHTVGIPATFLNSTLEAGEAGRRIREAMQGKYKLLYIAPERLESDWFRQWMHSMNISFVAIDEAHCVSQWGHDFRPSYVNIAPFVQDLPSRPLVAAFTATATTEVTQDIARLLELDDPEVVVTGFGRSNLELSVLRGVNKRDFVFDYAKAHTHQPGIVYAATRKEVDELYEQLRRKGLAAGHYHAGLSDEERARNQEAFLYDDVRVMVATNAFGMGIDKSNVRYVIHYNMPKNMEAYYQEAGRAGRDGDPSECMLLFSAQDILTQKFLIEQNQLSQDRKSNEYKKLQTMIDYCHTPRCLQNYILQYFGDEGELVPCGNCSSCKDDRETVDITVEAQKIFSCVRRMQERFGISMVAGVLKGSRNKKVLQYKFDNLPTYGIMKDRTEKEIADLINVLIAEGYMGLSEGQYPVVRLQAPAVEVLQGRVQVFQKVTPSQPLESAVDNMLFEQLRLLRRDMAAKEKVPPYIIFNDSTLREMSERCPTTEAQMLKIKGVGEVKFRNYGLPFLELLQEYVREQEAYAGEF
ncbi:DNA helicase RecQ [Paenibacillus chitinolyticus]|uniref:DNA helicase RecQ n=1 Tax=Paenibacillus chitinolyticus TaxID=79263 RepID=A0A410X4R0_9BACL|nr:DNA helicase RecQ [Paenibacillus chitinolyticus]MCY9593411.1 DNA helicase RecQ [Paenibacillus chitinolyticus]MCY9597073.1 DNA helicase RecQ [Paenibacillus chitinolyticus]QAV21585.1 DNA helicase RecQ [Paenibacillus chitinolyticus]GKS14276.1 DNA helicase RecQ [Paenibacillus chitinolyticus]